MIHGYYVRPVAPSSLGVSLPGHSRLIIGVIYTGENKTPLNKTRTHRVNSTVLEFVSYFGRHLNKTRLMLEQGL